MSLLLPLLASAATPTTVAIDLSGLDEASFAALDGVAFEKTATVRLVQEGFAVVARTATPQVLVSLRLNAEPRALVLSAPGPDGPLTREVPWGSEPLGELHLELTQKLAELTRTVSKAPTPVASAPPPPRWELSAAFGVLVREGGTEPLGMLGLRWGNLVRVAIDVGLSGGRGVGISVFEGTLSAGPGLAFAVSEHFRLELSLLLGALLHSWAIDDAAADDRTGTHFNAVVTLPLVASWAFSPAFHLGLRVAPGWGQGRAHLSGETELWSRGAFRLDASVFASFAW